MNRFILYALLLSKLISQELSQSLLTVIDTSLIKNNLRYHLTPLLLDIAKNGKSFSVEKKYELQKWGFDFNSPLVSRSSTKRSESDGLDENYDIGIIRLHYTTSGYHAVNNSDVNGTTIKYKKNNTNKGTIKGSRRGCNCCNVIFLFIIVIVYFKPN